MDKGVQLECLILENVISGQYFLKLSSNFQHSLLRYFEENLFKKLNELSISDERLWC